MSVLVRGGGWVTAAELADIVGVTPRSIRTYVAALAARERGAFLRGGVGRAFGAREHQQHALRLILSACRSKQIVEMIHVHACSAGLAV